jgi:hypothetical protein
MTHLSTRRKGKKISIPLVVASERGTAQTDLRGSLRALRRRGSRANARFLRRETGELQIARVAEWRRKAQP